MRYARALCPEGRAIAKAGTKAAPLVLVAVLLTITARAHAPGSTGGRRSSLRRMTQGDTSPAANLLVVGAGNIGRAVGARAASRGHAVAYWDVHPAVRDQLSETGAVVLAPSAVHGSFDLVYVCVPTPTLNGRFSSAQVEGALTTAASLVSARRFTTIVVRSTLLPGMTDTVVRPLLARLAPAGQWGPCLPALLRARTRCPGG